MTVLAKGKTRGQLKAARDRLKAKVDHAENEKVRQRSGEFCEVRIVSGAGAYVGRCQRLATEIHHLLGGWRKRGRGPSALAERKQYVCTECHRGITGTLGGKTLVRVGGVVPHWTDCYRRVE